MRTGTKQYSNGEITIVWNAEKCKHAGHCWSGMMKWENPLVGSTKQIIDIVNKCPNKALHYFYNIQCDTLPNQFTETKHFEIQPQGPLIVKGPLKIKYQEKVYENDGIVSICRCGGSRHQPYCDNSHETIDFKDE